MDRIRNIRHRPLLFIVKMSNIFWKLLLPYYGFQCLFLGITLPVRRKTLIIHQQVELIRTSHVPFPLMIWHFSLSWRSHNEQKVVMLLLFIIYWYNANINTDPNTTPYGWIVDHYEDKWSLIVFPNTFIKKEYFKPIQSVLLNEND